MKEKLLEKLYAEQARYKEYLLSKGAGEIFCHCFELSMRADILYGLEYYANLDDDQIKAMLDHNISLEDLYQDFSKKETDHMDAIVHTIRHRAELALRNA